jgi:1-acyl-sn-glycerol-3-phosphate acyltransferase
MAAGRKNSAFESLARFGYDMVSCEETMARTIFWFTYFWLLQLVSLIPLLVYLVLGLFKQRLGQKKFLCWFGRIWARQLIIIAGGRVEISGLENLPADGGMLFVSNHQGAFDVPLLLGYVPGLKGFVSKKESSHLPIIGIWMKVLHCIVLDRKDLRQSVQAIARGIRDLQMGRSLVIFPEGTRSKSRVMNRFKKGSFRLATRSGATIVPLTIDGSYRLLEANRGRIAPAKIHLHIHPPIRLQDLSAAEKGILTETVQQIIASKLPV